MKYNDFPSIGRRISKLGFGLMRLPKLEEGKEAIDRKEAARLIDLAYRSGVNYFDTAYVYHDGESELFAGEALKKYPRESYCLATKLPGWAMRDGTKTPEMIFNEQLTKCDVDYFDFYLMHNINRDMYEIFKKTNSYEYLKEQKKLGKIKRLGFSFHGDLELLNEVLDKYEWDFAQIQLNYYDWDASQGKEFYEALEAHGVPCIVMEPVRGGSLQKLNDEARAVFSELSDASPASYALRYVAQLPNVLVVLSGMSTFEQVADNIRTFDEALPLDEKETEAVNKANILFRSNFAIPCTACKYCTATCPAGIDIPGCFAAYNEYNKTRDTADFAKAYAQIPESARADCCLECEACLEHCPQQIKIPDMLKKVAKLK